LKEIAHDLSEDTAQRNRVNQQLARVHRRYENHGKIRHFARILFEDVDPQQIRACIKKDLSDLKIAIHYGCHYFRDPFLDQQEHHRASIEALVALTGAEVVHYPREDQCCGGPVLPVDERVALSMAKDKLDVLTESGADALCVVCPFCSVMYDGNQKVIETQFETRYQLPVLYLTQILGMSFGLDEKALGLHLNVVKAKALRERVH
jgi:heterodisulfide reductase subunit B